jgi:nucleoside-diphosphate-sugar epimerase
MKKILLTGATGFLGSHLLEMLVQQQYSVVILKRSTSDLQRINHLLPFITAYDIDRVNIGQVFEEQAIDGVIHTACNYGRNGEPADEIVGTNILFGLTILEEAAKANVKLFVNTDTFFNSHHYNQSYLKEYTLTKKQFCEWLLIFSDRITTVNMKLQHLYGPGDSTYKFIPWVTAQLLEGKEQIDLTNGLQKRDFIYVDDVVSAFLVILNNYNTLNREFTEVETGTGISHSIRHFVEVLKGAVENMRGEKDKTLLRFGAIKNREDEIVNVICDNSVLKTLGWNPAYSIESGCVKMVSELVKA